VITGVERRRRWSVEEKLRVVAESHAPGRSVAMVARRHGINPNQLYTWRRLAAEGAFGAAPGPPEPWPDGVPASEPLPVFVPVELREEPRPAARVAAARRAHSREGAGVEVIEVELPNGCRLRFDGRIQTAILRRVVAVLKGVRR
jgi:transposase-like protein